MGERGIDGSDRREEEDAGERVVSELVWTCRVRVVFQGFVICRVGQACFPMVSTLHQGQNLGLHADCMRADSIWASLEHYWLL